MKKKTKSKLNNNFSLTFCFAILFCALGASTNFFGFYKNFTSTLFKFNEEPVAVITFKYKTAQRKLLERLVWDRLKQESPLYNGDTIHTSESSEATITFVDGNKIELFESTMIQIWKDKDSGIASTDIYDGSVYVQTSNKEDSSGLVLKSVKENIEIAVENGSSASIDSSLGETVQIISGTASISNTEGIVQKLSEGQTIIVKENDFVQPQLTMISPSPNKKILSHTKENQNIEFQWKTLNMQDIDLVLELSADKNFSKIQNSYDIKNIENVTMSLQSGIYYWRIRDASIEDVNQILVGSRIQIIQSLPPKLLSPVQNYEYVFRKRKPSVRFIWSETNRADSYRLLIADNSSLEHPIIDQRCKSASSIISTLKEGIYYWQVIPYFSINEIGYSAHSEIHSFKVEKTGNLIAPIPLVPANNSVVNIEKTAKKASFSWKAESEALSYKIEFSRDKDFSAIEKTIESSKNYISLIGSQEFSVGRWYWRITQQDQEGNFSKFSEPISFQAMEGKPEQHTVEPTDGYGIAENLMLDLNFTWKKNLPDYYSSFIQIATDKDFEDVLISVPSTGFSLNGVYLQKGDYYWRLYSKSNVDDFELFSSSKKLRVLPNLEKPIVITPKGKAVARDGVPYKFSWDQVKGADFYKVNIYRISDGLLVYEDVVYDTSLELDMFNPEEFVDRVNYKLEIQAKSNSIPGVISRRNGDLYEASFQLVKLRPIEIVIPKRKTVIDGIEAALKKIIIKWDSVDDVSQAQIIVSKKKEKKSVPIIKIPTDEEFASGYKIAPNTVLIQNPDLINGGNYEIIVKAKTIDGIDITNSDKKYLGEFSVSPIEPLPKVKGLSSTPTKFDVEYLRNLENPRSITFKWNAVSKATDYEFEIKTKKGRSLYKKILPIKTTSVVVDWLKLVQAQKTEKQKKELYNGNFIWTVEAIRRVDNNRDGVLDTKLQPGILSEEVFVSELPVLQKASGKGAVNPYGK